MIWKNDGDQIKSKAMPIGIIRLELIFSHPTGKASGSGIVPPDVLKTLEVERSQHGIVTKWLYEIDPTTGQRLPAFTPIEGGRLALIESRGIGHCDRFLATFEVKEVTSKGKKQRQMRLVDAKPLQASQGTGPSLTPLMGIPSLRERLAALEHEEWAHWTRYMLDHLTPENTELWRRQIDTPYEELSESEKDSDREWADQVLRIVQAMASPPQSWTGWVKGLGDWQ